MTSQEQDQVLIDAIHQHGAQLQIDMLHEEVGELFKAINKVKRLGGLEEFGFKKPDKQSSIKYCLEYFNLCSELADVKIMVGQLEKMLMQDAIDLSKDRKIERLKTRLENE